MDHSKRLETLRRQIDEANAGRPGDFKGWRQRTTAALRTVMGADHPSVKELDDVSYSLMMFTDRTPQSEFDRARERGVQSAVAILEGAMYEIELGAEPSAASRLIGDLHPWIVGAVSGLWDGGHHRQAVSEASRAIEIRLKTMTGADLTGAPLITEAFNPAPPKQGERRLRFPEYQPGTKDWTSAHEGAMHFGRGCMQRIRNLAEHSSELDQQEAIESLAALSLLARWIEAANVVIGEV